MNNKPDSGFNAFEDDRSPTKDELVELIKNKEIDHIDFGCSKGGSLEMAKMRFGGQQGLGIDIVPEKVEQTRKAGYQAISYDINDLPHKKLVCFCVLSHFLEHVPNTIDVNNFIKKACIISSEFVFIQQPFFDADGYLATQGLKCYWSDWHGHPNHMTSLDLWLSLRNLQQQGHQIRFSIHTRRPIKNSIDSRIHPLDSPIDQHHYDPTTHQPKNGSVAFQFPVFGELICLISMPQVNHDRLLERIPFDATIIDVDGKTGLQQRNTTDRIKINARSALRRMLNRLKS